MIKPCMYKGKLFASLSEASTISAYCASSFGNLVRAKMIADIELLSIDEYEERCGHLHPVRGASKKPLKLIGSPHSAAMIRQNRLINYGWPKPDWRGMEGEV